MAKINRSDRTLPARIWPQTPGDEIVISGISGKFPSSRNLTEFSENLYNKVDMVHESEKRWPLHNSEIPARMGVIEDAEKFDAQFFGVPFKQTNTMDPQCRLLIETAYEAIVDAGVCPKSIRGTKTGVFIGACFGESEKTFFYDQVTSSGLGITGCSRAMLANRVSYSLGLTGPSFLLDTACSSSMYALDVAFSSIRSGECDAALVGGSNLLLHPYTTLQFARLGVLAKDGYCRPFDHKASGYTRSEAICVMYLQRAKDSKRVYANVVYSKANCDGYKTEGVTYPSGAIQQELLAEFYDDVRIDPTSLSYVEAHSTGTVVGDPEECRALDNIFCQNRKDPLYVGSVKSNIGHTESSSGACSIAKVILTFENDMIPPNINFEKIRDSIPALVEKRMIVVNEKRPFTGEHIAINSFGFGGANAHALFGKNLKDKINNGLPDDDIPRLINWSGRTEEAVETILDALESQPLDAEYIALLHSVQSEPTPGYLHRGYSVLAKNDLENAVCLARASKHHDDSKPIVWIFTGMGSQWTGMGKSLMVFPRFRQSIQICHDTLKPYGVDLISVITSDDPKTFDYIVNSFIGIAAIQIGLVDMLRLLEIPADYFLGHSVGELGCAYADGTMTAEQMILAAYSRGMVSVETKTIEGSMAAIGLSYENIKDILPPSIEVACHNSFESTTISGPKSDVSTFVAQLKSQGIFAKEVQCSNIPYHSRYIAEMGPKLLNKLHEIIPNPVKRSSKWLSSSVLQSQWNTPQSQFSSAEYHTNNLLKPVLFEETSLLLPTEAITIEVAPHGLLQAIIKKSMPHSIHIPLTQRGSPNNAGHFLSALGKLFIHGFTFPIERLYPKVDFPVSRGTPMIAPLLRWDHSEDWFVMKFEVRRAANSGERKVKLSLDEQIYIAGHIIDGRVIVPATTYLELVWETISMIATGTFYSNIDVEMEDVRFHRATSINPGQRVDLNVMIHYGNGQFEITENGHQVVSGSVRILEDREYLEDEPEEELKNTGDYPLLEKDEFYKELRLRGYHYQDLFRGVQKASGDGSCGIIKWQDNWPAFIDCMLQLNILAKDSRSLYLPTRIRKIRVNSIKHTRMLGNLPDDQSDLVATYDPELKMIKCGGVEIYEMVANSIARRKPPGTEVMDSYRFLPLVPSETLTLDDGARVVTQLILENTPITSKLKIAELDSEHENSAPIISVFEDVIAEIPSIKGDLTFYTDQNVKLDNVQNAVRNAVYGAKGCALIIGSDLLANPDILNLIEENRFLLSRQTGNTTFTDIPNRFTLVTALATEQGTLVLIRRKSKPSVSKAIPTIIEVSSNDHNYEWLDLVKTTIKAHPIILLAQNDPSSGLLGLVNCLRREPFGENIRCVIIMDRFAPKFTLENALYATQLEHGLTINIYRNSMWGTYRFLKLKQLTKEIPRLDHVYANVQRLGDLSSFDWFSGPLKTTDTLVNVHYSSINFRDVMLASGRLPVEVCRTSRTDDECVLGLEFSGITSNGDRVMGMVKYGAMASQIKPVEHLTWIIPKDLSLRDGATIPAVYITVYYAFFFYRTVARGNSILIHAGSGGIGLAAIRIALAYGLDVYTTVSTEQKKKFILSLFPQLKEQNIGNSRDCSFEQMIMRRTKGRGVDFVLNSLSDEKLLASVRCLARAGTFLEIGKFDIMNNSALGMSGFQRETTFRAVFADNLIYMPEERKIIYELIDKDLRTGIIQPLHSTVFQVNEIEQAYRYMSTGKHVGKVMIQVRDSEQSLATVPIKAHPKVYCKSNLVYILAGGLGGFGLELSDWLVLRGARILVLNSRRGVTTSYQAFRIKLWESYGCKVIINTADISTYQGSKTLLVESLAHGQIGGIFNLAAVLRDSLLENQTVAQYHECVAPKAIATRFLNELSRILCPQLEHFVVFSSVSCGMGNAGQSNYGMANSIMERIIEQRVQDKLPGKAIQWGAIGEVGLVAEMTAGKIDVEVAGTLQQRIESCLNVLDVLLTSPQPIVSSLVVADKASTDSTHDGQMSLIKSVMKIMSIRDTKSISKNTTLAEIGMDSLMSVELKQMMEREFDVFLTPQELRSITFGKLQEMSTSNGIGNGDSEPSNKRDANLVNTLFRNLGDESVSDQTLLSINQIENNSPRIVFIPGIEGVGGSAWHTLGANLNSPAKLLQLMKSQNEATLEGIADSVIQEVYQHFVSQDQFFVIGHSFGTLIAVKIASLLEKLGKVGHVILIDGSPAYLKRLAQGLVKTTKVEDYTDVLFMVIFTHFCSSDLHDKFIATLSKCTEQQQKIDLITEFLSTEIKTSYSMGYLRKLIEAILNRLKVVISLNVEGDEIAAVMDQKLKSAITLIRPTQASFTDIIEDYGLDRYSEQAVTIKYVDGNHFTVLENTELTDIINNLTSSNS